MYTCAAVCTFNFINYDYNIFLINSLINLCLFRIFSPRRHDQVLCWFVFNVSLLCFPESSLLNKAPPTPTMYKYRPTYSSPGKNHTALTHAYANQVNCVLVCMTVCFCLHPSIDVSPFCHVQYVPTLRMCPCCLAVLLRL